MKGTEDKLQHRRLRTPQENGGVFVDPPWVEIGHQLTENMQLRRGEAEPFCDGTSFATYDCQGRSLGELARQARRDLLSAATSYTSAYRDVPSSLDASEFDQAPLILTGHQPELFHPGVWCKNFAAAGLASENSGVAVHLIIDSDAARSDSINVPSGTVQRPVLQSVPLTTWQPQVPHEECRIADPQMLADFGPHAAQLLEGLIAQPLLRTFWPRVVARAQETDNLGLCLAQARHQLEGDWGLQTLEIPHSHVCRSEPFYWFVAHVLAHLPRFVEIYNASVAQYRRIHGIRSGAHPVPDLTTDGRWLEAPFWIWAADDPRRRPMFVAQQGDDLVLSDRRGLKIALRLSSDASASTAVGQLVELQSRGVRIRTRALLTTMFARLLLADLFIHGIGGAKYDQLSDLLIRRFFGLIPPHFMTLSGTLRLPIDFQTATPGQLRDVEQTLRRMRYHPEKFLFEGQDGAVDAAERDRWIANKQKWVGTPQTRDNARQRCREIRGSNAALQRWLTEETHRWQFRRDRVREQLRHAAILASREYPFCFYPEENLRHYLLDTLLGGL